PGLPAIIMSQTRVSLFGVNVGLCKLAWRTVVPASGDGSKWAIGGYVFCLPNCQSMCRSRVFFQAEDGIRDWSVTGVQTCALPIWPARLRAAGRPRHPYTVGRLVVAAAVDPRHGAEQAHGIGMTRTAEQCGNRGLLHLAPQIGRASWRERGAMARGGASSKK